MARFRAYASDDSDDNSGSEVEEVKHAEEHHESESEEEEGSLSSGSDMDEDEPSVHHSHGPKASGNALVEGEDGDYHFRDGEESGDEYAVHVSAPSSASPPPLPKGRGDPTIIPWAQHVGVDAQKMHVMQTSLFRMPEEAAALRALNQQVQPQPSHRTLRLPPSQILTRKHSRDSEGDGLRIDSRERASFGHDVEPPVYRPSRKYARVESSESTFNGNENSVFDAGLAFGRSFRVGWGPNGTLVHLGTLCGPSSTPKSSANSSIVTKTVVPLVANSNQATALSEKLLQHHLSNSPIESDEDGIPFASPSPTLTFSSFTSLFPPADRSYEASLFRLGQALFDSIDLRLGASITADIRNRVTALRRKAALSAWLEDAVAPAIEADLRADPSADAASIAFTFLTGNQTDKALASATDGGYFKLATLISQAGGDWEFREDLKEQLTIWQEERIDAHIDEGVKKVYTLLAGIVGHIVEGSKGGGLEKCPDIDVLKGLDWKRAFGLHLWFSEPIDAKISDVFRVYEELVATSPQRVARPTPWYSEKSASKSQWNLPSSPAISDGLYSLIRLHADPGCSLSQALSPLAFGPSPADVTVPWHLYILLSRCMRVRDFSDRGEPVGHQRLGDEGSQNDQEDEVVEGHSPSADLLASSYAQQLESLGMIQEALFVLLHIEGSRGREKAIKDILARSAPQLDEWMTRGIVGSLKIPLAWVNEAKAQFALDRGEVFEAYELFITAKLYNSAHDLAVLELAPEVVLRRDLELLRTIFERFEGKPVDGWHTRGKIFLDYVHIMTRLPDLLATQSDDAIPDAHQKTEIEELTRSVPKIIGLLPDILRDAGNLRHSAALAEMTSSLVAQVDKARPLVMAQIQPSLINESTKMAHLQSLSLARFMKRIDLS